MTKCEEFLAFVDYLMQNCKEPVNPSENVQAYLDALRSSERTGEKKEFTSNGKAILQSINICLILLSQKTDCTAAPFQLTL